MDTATMRRALRGHGFDITGDQPDAVGAALTVQHSQGRDAELRGTALSHPLGRGVLVWLVELHTPVQADRVPAVAVSVTTEDERYLSEVLRSTLRAAERRANGLTELTHAPAAAGASSHP
ncbi:MAG: hypothetical protein AB1941_10105 [Gemmatimonadota bacterium]